MEPAEVLEQLDAAAEQAEFPDLNHGYYYAIDARLRGYRDDRRWALIVETVGYNPRAANVIDVLHVFGNCLTRGEPGFENDDLIDRIDNWDEIEDPDAPECYRGGALVVRGQAIIVPAQPGEPLIRTFRRLVPDHRDLLLADEAELRRRIPADLPEVMVVLGWRHPDPIEEVPSGSEAFRQLADVLASGDLDRYAPTRPANTHWSHWPESGLL
jgi:hypothetical protein